MASSTFVDLKLNRNLINPNFGGYKLSLDSLPVYRKTLDEDIDICQLPDSLYSYQHLKAFGVHNHLYHDQWNSNSVYFVDAQWHIMQVVMQGLKWQDPAVQYTIPDAANRRLITGRVNVSLNFTSSVLLTLADGTGRLFLFNTGERNQNGTDWKVCYSGLPFGDGQTNHFTILHSTCHSDDSGYYVEVLCLHVERNSLSDATQRSPEFITKLEWLTLYSDNMTTFEVIRIRTLEGISCPDYAAVTTAGSALIVLSQKPFRFCYDSVKPVGKEACENKTNESSKIDAECEPVYTWSQTDSDILVLVKLPPNCSKADIDYKLTSNHVHVGLKQDTVLLSGDLFATIDVDASTWILNDDHNLEIHLTKSEAGAWSVLIPGDVSGQMTFTPEQIAEMNERLDKFTSDSMNPADDKKPAFNVQQLEECDAFPDDSSALWCYDGESHQQIQQVNLSSNQWLFNASGAGDDLPMMCLRHDVDGVMWQPAANSSQSVHAPSWQHVGTFDAFGYVVASKQQRKFTTCPSAMSFVAVADCVRHVYIYRRPTSIASPIRNRRTGETVSAVARQQLVSLDSVDDIMGMCANNSDIFILSGRTVYALRVNSD